MTGGVVVALLILSGCAGRLPLPMSASDSSDTGASSAGSSDGSANSSAGSGESSGQSAESSNASSGSSGSTGENSTNESTAESSRGTTDGTVAGVGNAVVVIVPVSSTTTLAATTGGLMMLIWSQQNPPRPEVEAAAYVYLRSVRHRLEEDLALGAGGALEDLAALAQIRRRNLSRFATLLQRNRKELLALMNADALTPARAAAALRRVGELAATDPVLAEDGRSAVEEVAVAASR